MADDFKSAQSSHAFERKAVRALMKETGVSDSQARAALHQTQAQAGFNRFAAVQQANMAPRPAPEFKQNNVRLDAQPIQNVGVPAVPGAPQALPTPVEGDLLQIDFVAIEGSLQSIMVRATIV